MSGMYREFVSAGRTGNPLSGLSFEYQFNLDPASAGAIQTFIGAGFAGQSTNVTFTPGGMVPPSEASRSSGDGDAITFLITDGGGVQPGQISMWLIVDTDASGEVPNTLTLAGNGGSTHVAALGPAPVPEPRSLMLGLVSLFLAGALGYRRLRQPALA